MNYIDNNNIITIYIQQLFLKCLNKYDFNNNERIKIWSKLLLIPSYEDPFIEKYVENVKVVFI